MDKILIVGSSNTDMVVKTNKFPSPGETILGGDFFMNSGGKGANQAVAAARLGGNVVFVCKTGNDIFGQKALELFKYEGIDTAHAITDTQAPSGIALITVDNNAENSIVVAPGANAKLLPEDIAHLNKIIEGCDYVLMQLEIPLETIEFITEVAWGKGKKVILNPAPAQPLSINLIKKLFLITPNQTEAEILTGIKVDNQASAIVAAKKLNGIGAKNVIITMGAKGALVQSEGETSFIPAQKVKAVDTTAAGDVFNGALTVALSQGKGMCDAVNFASKAAAISVTRAGAQSSAPYLHEMDKYE